MRMTHADVPPERLHLHGVTASMIRLSVGLEDVEDIWNDLTRALAIADGKIAHAA